MLHRPRRPVRCAMAATGSFAIAFTLIGGLGPLPLPARPIGAGTVRTVPIPFSRGSASGALLARTDDVLASRPGAPAVWQSAAVPADGARMVGLSWAGAVPAAVPGGGAVFARSDDGHGFGAWSRLDLSDEGPDQGSPEFHPGRVYTDPLWLDAGARAVQVRFAFPGRSAATVQGLAAHLITPDLAPTPDPVRGPGRATAMTALPTIISRAGWGANEAIRRGPPSYAATVKAAFVHHTVQSNSYTRAESAALVRADYLYHVRVRGWNDIGYTFLVDRFGQIFEGRYGGITRAVIGACTGGFNTATTCPALIGDFSSAAPPAAAVHALERLLAWKLDLTHVDPLGRTVLTSSGGGTSRYPAGTRVTVRTVSGHRDVGRTECPGARVYALLPAIRAATAATGQPKIYGGAPSAGSVDLGRATTVTLAPSFSTTVRWRASVTEDGQAWRTWSGAGRSARLSWNGRDPTGVPAPAGTATVTVTAQAGSRSARPLVARVAVRPARFTVPDGTLLSGSPARRVKGGGLWSYVGGVVTDPGPSPAVGPSAARLVGLSQPLADYPDGTLLRAPRSTGVWVVAEGQRHAVPDDASMAAHGYAAGSVLVASTAQIRRLPVGAPLRAADPLPDGTLVTGAGGALWRIEDGQARPVAAAARAVWLARTAPVAAATSGPRDVAAYPAGAQLGFPDGALLRNSGDGRVYVVSDGRRRWLESSAVAAGLGYRTGAALTVAPADLAANPAGAPLGLDSPPPSGALVRAGTTTWLVVGERRVAVPDALLGSFHRGAQPVAASRLAPLRVLALTLPGGTYGVRQGQVVVVSGGRLRPVAADAASRTGVAGVALQVSDGWAGALPLGPPVGAAAPFPDDTLWRDGGQVYRIEGGRRRPIAAAAVATWTPAPRPVPAGAAGTFRALPLGPALGFRDGTLIRDAGDARVYAIADGERRYLRSRALMIQLGLRLASVRLVGHNLAGLHPVGPPLG